MNERVLRYQITEEDDGRTVAAFLKERLQFSARQISRLKFREDGIRVNGEQYYVTWKLKTGDRLEIGLSENRRPGKTDWLTTGEVLRLAAERGIDFTFPPLRVLYEDEDVLAVYKESGLVCHPSPGHYADTLANQVAEYLTLQRKNTQGQDRAVQMHVIGRLDKDTSGIVLFAKNPDAAASLQRQRDDGRCHKVYAALVRGSFDKSAGCIDTPIRKVPGVLMKMETIRTDADDNGWKPATTWYEVIAQRAHPDGSGAQEEAALVQCRIEHGRTHQIRVHLSSIGHPLLYDEMYGEENRDGKHFFLHAGEVTFLQPFTGEKVTVRAPLPEEFMRELQEWDLSCLLFSED